MSEPCAVINTDDTGLIDGVTKGRLPSPQSVTLPRWIVDLSPSVTLLFSRRQIGRDSSNSQAVRVQSPSYSLRTFLFLFLAHRELQLHTQSAIEAVYTGHVTVALVKAHSLISQME